LAVAVVLVWAITGPLFGFGDTWQLVINTGTTIVTFLMVFLIQATQNRDTLALQLKLDELILATRNARNHIARHRGGGGRRDRESEGRSPGARGLILTGTRTAAPDISLALSRLEAGQDPGYSG
jgi:hypothetical protein